MAKLFIQDTTLTAIADAIRTKTDTPSYEYLDYMECSVSKSNMGMGEYEFAHFTFPGASSIQVVVYNFNKQYTGITSGKGSFKIIEGIEESSAYYGVDLAASQTYNFEGDSFTVYSNGKCSVYVAEFKVYGFDAEGNPLQYVVESEGGEPAKFKPTEMPAAILAISGGGSSGGITPSGELAIYDNGSYDVAQYASAVVSVEKGVFPEGDFPITENGQYNITRYNTVTVEVPTGGVEPEGTITITANGLHDVSAYASAQVAVSDVTPQTVTISGDAKMACAGALAGAYINTFPNGVQTSNLTSCVQMFYKNTTVVNIPFKIKPKYNYYVSCAQMFEDCTNLHAAPVFSADMKLTHTQYMFKNCTNLNDISGLFSDGANWEYQATTDGYTHYGMFYGCESLRSISTEYLQKLICIADAYETPYEELFAYCYNLDEIVGLPVANEFKYSGAFTDFIPKAMCLKRFTFAKNADGTPIVAKWKNQTLDLSDGIGYCNNYYYPRNSGRTWDYEIKDESTYASYKNNADAYTYNYKYARYNKASAVETINSLPDCSATGTNTIKFDGTCGSLTDAGAINTMTEAEIAVAAAKGWTVTFV